MFTIELKKVCCNTPVGSTQIYKLTIKADFNTATLVRNSLPSFIYDKDNTVLIVTDVFANEALVPPSNAGTKNDFTVSYLYNVTPLNSNNLIFKVGVCSTIENICAFLNCNLPNVITSDDGSLILRVFQYYSKDQLCQGAEAASSQPTVFSTAPCPLSRRGCNRNCPNRRNS